MDEKLLQGEGVFEITDHTTASDWERFIANLEEILTDWDLNKQSDSKETYKEMPSGYISSGLWHEKHQELKMGNFTFDVRYQYLDDSNLKQQSASSSDPGRHDVHVGVSEESSDGSEYHDATFDNDVEDDEEQRKIPKEEEKTHGEYELPKEMPQCLLDLVATTNDFASKAHCLVRWYNLRKFITLAPRGDTLVSEDRVKLVLSSASVALANIDCHLPIFVQILNPKNNFYQGISEHLNIRTMYEMVFYKHSLKQYGYLSELISAFREKTGCNLNDPISATIRLNYCLDYFDLFVKPQDEFAGNEHSEDEQYELMKMTAKKKTQSMQSRSQDMRTGASFDQVKEALEECLPHPFRILRLLHVAALWPPVSDKVINDSQVHSDLDPAEAPIWTIRCLTSDACNMKIVHDTQAVYELLTSAINYAYDKLDANQVFTDCDRETLKSQCLKLSYDLATHPEVTLSKNPSDSIRKVIALLFYRASQLRAELEPLDQLVEQLKQPSTNEIYRDFKRQKTSVREFIIRTQISRPFNPISTPALPQRMFCTVCDGEFRLCGAFSELCN